MGGHENGALSARERHHYLDAGRDNCPLSLPTERTVTRVARYTAPLAGYRVRWEFSLVHPVWHVTPASGAAASTLQEYVTRQLSHSCALPCTLPSYLFRGDSHQQHLLPRRSESSTAATTAQTEAWHHHVHHCRELFITTTTTDVRRRLSYCLRHRKRKFGRVTREWLRRRYVGKRQGLFVYRFSVGC
jgi:hypothetical protein